MRRVNLSGEDKGGSRQVTCVCVQGLDMRRVNLSMDRPKGGHLRMRARVRSAASR